MTVAAANARTTPPRFIRDAVRDLIRRGFLPVPVPFGQKGPHLTGWPSLRVGLDDVDRYFTEDDNVGVRLGDHPIGKALCDSDFDTIEAVRAARRRMPATDLWHGRASKPWSHAWHWTDLGTQTKKYVDPVDNKTVILERRCNTAKEGTALQTNVPPSVNPTGEQQQWARHGEPADALAAELIAAHNDIAAVALLARHLPSGRHEAALHFAGWLVRRGVPAERVALLLALLADALDLSARADEFERLATDTAAAIAAGRPATGGKKLIEHLGEHGKKILGRIAEWLGIAEPAAEADDGPPMDLWGSHLAGIPPLDLEATVPAVLGAHARDVAARQGCDEALVALFDLAACAGAIDDGHQVQPKQHDREWRTSARLWNIAAEEIGHGKSPALRAALRPLREIDQRWGAEDAPAHQRHALAVKLYNRELEKWVKAGGPGEPPTEPVRPPVRRRVMDDFTIEKLQDVLADNPGGVLIEQDEVAGLIGGMDAYRPSGVAKDQPAYLQLRDGSARRFERVKRIAIVPNWGASLVGGIQPAKLRQLAPKMLDDGLLARCLVFFGRGGAPPIDRPADRVALNRYRDTIERLAALPVPADPYTMDAGAHLRREYVVRIARAVAVLPTTAPGLKAALSKWEALFAQLALTMHLTEAASEGRAPSLIISEATAARVARLLIDYVLPHTAHLYGELLGQDHLTHARWLAGYILARGSTKITAREIGRAYHALRDDRRALQDAMQTLTVAGWATPRDGEAGRPPTKWRVNPAVHELFGVRAEAERQRRRAIQDRIKEAAEMLGIQGEVTE